MFFYKLNPENLSEGKINITTITNSTIAFILSFIIIFILFDFTFAVVSSFYGLKPVVLYPLINFTFWNYKWDIESITVIYTSGAVVSLLLAGIFNLIFLYFKNKNRFLKLLFLWGTLHAYNIFFSHLIDAPASDSYIGGVLAWYYWTSFSKWILSIFGMLMLVFIGFVFCKPFLSTALRYRYIRRYKVRNHFILTDIIIPYIIGYFICFIFNWHLRGTLMVLLPFCYGFIIIGMWLFSSLENKQITHKTSNFKVISKTGIIIIFIGIIALRLYLLYPIWF
jgi:hypothetical protein